MTTLREAAQQALEALHSVEWHGGSSAWMLNDCKVEGAIHALRAALAEPVQAESVTDAMMNLVDRLGSEADQVEPRAWHHLLVYAPKQKPVQEPVAWSHINGTSDTKWHPPQRKPLTREEVDQIWNHEKAFPDIYAIARAIERAHGIGGTDESA